MAQPPAYADGTLAAVGDRVLIERGRTKAVVESLCYTEEALAIARESSIAVLRIAFGRAPDFGPEGPSALLLAAPFGRIAWYFDNDIDPMRFVRRGRLDRSDSDGVDVDDWW